MTQPFRVREEQEHAPFNEEDTSYYAVQLMQPAQYSMHYRQEGATHKEEHAPRDGTSSLYPGYNSSLDFG